ncbi:MULTISPECIES: DUF3817 domain-containing protein [Nocardia]|uniref:DUF3817 domain-containing protein n=1 Tax=Nocardia aurea TaxID=2144174 RepID=A0ABV3G545_9NOCA|nr:MULTISPECIES: DUF3817 domain-containing protein [Nocardia]
MGYFDLRSVAGRFRFFAVLEALSWLGLLIGMAFKYIPEPGNEIGVKIFGPIHGAVFVLFLLSALLAARELRWNWLTTILALLSSIPPFFTVVFEVWAARTGRLGTLETVDSTGTAAAAGATS